MSSAGWARVKELFDGAVRLPIKERGAFLDRECNGESEVREEVERLLAAEPAAASFLDSDDRPDVTKLLEASPDDFRPGARVGRYALQRLIASGGMGTVWEAVQDHPRRTVAVKTIRQGFASTSRRQRFQLEAEVLGRLRHPGIAQIFEAGTHESESGTFPYFAMELVEGARDVVRYANEEGLDRRRRLELLAKICDAVHHGHQRGIVHRDLKPANLLVDAAGHPKVIDFGLARATRYEPTVTVAETMTGALVGTLPYMSPEQLGGDPEDLDTRSDVYSLGVLLYQFLTGRLPHDTEGLPLQAAVKELREAEPKPPAGLPDDLVWVITRALEKDRERRYASASELAADLRRYLGHEPVMAGPPSTRYRLGKLVRRHRVAVSTAALVVAALLVGLVGVLWKNQQLREERDIAIEINEFLDKVLTSFSNDTGGRDVPMSEVLDEASRRIGDAFPERPDVEARIRGSLGHAYVQINRYEEAEAHLRVGLDAALAEFGEDHEVTLEGLQDLATALRSTGRHEEALPYYQDSLDVAERLYGPESVRAAHAKVQIGSTLRMSAMLPSTMDRREKQDRYEEAERLFTEAAEVFARAEGEGHPNTLNARGLLALTLLHLDRLEEGLAISEGVLDRGAQTLGEDHPTMADYFEVHGEALKRLERWDEAEEVLRIAVDIKRDALPEGDVPRLLSFHSLAKLLYERARYEEAVEIAAELYEETERHLEPEAHLREHARTIYARSLTRTGRHAEAEAVMRAGLEHAWSDDHRRDVAADLAQMIEAQGRPDEADALRREHGLAE